MGWVPAGKGKDQKKAERLQFLLVYTKYINLLKEHDLEHVLGNDLNSKIVISTQRL